TEGWAAGLQLAAASLRGAEKVAEQIQSLTGDFSDGIVGGFPGGISGDFFSDGFSGGHRLVVEYFEQQVMRGLPGHVQRFLLCTSVLDRLSASLCNALTGRADSQAMLEHLERANLFVTPLDAERRWYRYQPLFAHALRRLAAAHLDLAGLHQRASQWL